jgi:transcriptional regulator with XRE-family HTH domain
MEEMEYRSVANNKEVNPMDDLLKQLEHYRLENKITQETLAKDLGVAFSTISRWLNGKVTPNKIQAYHIEKFLKERGIYVKR